MLRRMGGPSRVRPWSIQPGHTSRGNRRPRSGSRSCSRPYTARQAEIDSHDHVKMDSDDVVRHLRDLLVGQGWSIEAGKTAAQKIHRPVLFGDNGTVRVKQELDGWHAGAAHRA